MNCNRQVARMTLTARFVSLSIACFLAALTNASVCHAQGAVHPRGNGDDDGAGGLRSFIDAELRREEEKRRAEEQRGRQQAEMQARQQQDQQLENHRRMLAEMEASGAEAKRRMDEVERAIAQQQAARVAPAPSGTRTRPPGTRLDPGGRGQLGSTVSDHQGQLGSTVSDHQGQLGSTASLSKSRPRTLKRQQEDYRRQAENFQYQIENLRYREWQKAEQERLRMVEERRRAEYQQLFPTPATPPGPTFNDPSYRPDPGEGPPPADINFTHWGASPTYGSVPGSRPDVPGLDGPLGMPGPDGKYLGIEVDLPPPPDHPQSGAATPRPAPSTHVTESIFWPAPSVDQSPTSVIPIPQPQVGQTIPNLIPGGSGTERAPDYSIEDIRSSIQTESIFWPAPSVDQSPTSVIPIPQPQVGQTIPNLIPGGSGTERAPDYSIEDIRSSIQKSVGGSNSNLPSLPPLPPAERRGPPPPKPTRPLEQWLIDAEKGFVRFSDGGVRG